MVIYVLLNLCGTSYNRNRYSYSDVIQNTKESSHLDFHCLQMCVRINWCPKIHDFAVMHFFHNLTIIILFAEGYFFGYYIGCCILFLLST